MSLHEKISSLYDDELETSEREQIVSSLKQNENQRQIWGRYSIISDALRKNLPANPSHDLRSRVLMAMESEPVLLAPVPEKSQSTPPTSNVVSVNISQKPRSDSFYKPVAGLAVAASVALASVLGFQMMSNSSSELTISNSQMLANTTPSTQELNIASDIDNSAPSTASLMMPDAEGGVIEFDDAIYAQQSLMDDGQWTRITRIGNILLDNNILANQPDLSVNVDLQTGNFPFAHATNLEAAQPK